MYQEQDSRRRVTFNCELTVTVLIDGAIIN